MRRVEEGEHGRGESERMEDHAASLLTRISMTSCIQKGPVPRDWSDSWVVAFRRVGYA